MPLCWQYELREKNGGGICIGGGFYFKNPFSFWLSLYTTELAPRSLTAQNAVNGIKGGWEGGMRVELFGWG